MADTANQDTAPQVLVTRPEADAEPLVHELAARGYGACLAPMLTIRFDPAVEVDLSGVQALLFTSANGVRAFVHLCPRRDLPVIAVGEATAEAARSAGFPDVDVAGGDSAALADRVVATRKPQDGVLFHAAGSVRAGDLKGQLAAQGFAVRRTPLYAAETARRLPDSAVRALRGGRVAAALFFSPRTAKTFVTLARTADLVDPCGSVTAVCLSSAVANTVSDLPWRDVHTAGRPDQAALLRALDAI